MALLSPQSLQKIELRELGNTGLKVSCVGFGASPLGNVFGNVSLDDAIASVREAFRLGINFFDTSPYYGGTLSETVLGKTLQALGVPRNEYIVSTKCGRYSEGFDFSAERVTKSIDESLARLQLDYVDILQCHDMEFGSLDQIVTETLPALQKLKEAGKIRFIGITGLPLEIFTYILDRVPPDTVDVVLSYCHYSVNDSTLEDLLPYLKSKGVGVISASPLAMGLLTESGPPEWHPASPELKSACQAAAAHCKEKGKNISKLSLQYSLSNKDISSVLVGMNSIRQVLIRRLPSLPHFFDIQAMPFISLFLLWLYMFKIHIMHFEVPTIAFFFNPTVACYFAFNEGETASEVTQLSHFCNHPTLLFFYVNLITILCKF